MSKEFLSAKVNKVEYTNKRDRAEYNGQWWLETGDKELASAVFGVCTGLNTQMQTMKHQFRMYRHLYGNSEAFFVPTTANNNLDQSSYLPDNRLVANTTQSIIDTAMSMISKNMPHPQFFTLGEDNYRMRQKAQILNAFVDGVSDTCTDDGGNLYDEFKKVSLDAFMIGTGALYVYDSEDNVKVERVLPDELLLDEVDGMFMKPRSIHRVKWVSKDELAYMFPKKEPELEQCTISNNSQGSTLNTNAALVEVVESWHIKSGKTAKDGLHCLCVANAVLMSERYDRPYFPFVFYRWKNRPIGFWGVGLVEELKSLQVRLNEVLHLIQLAQELVACPIVFTETGADVNSDHLLANDVFRQIEYNSGSAPPQIVTPTAVQAEMYAERDWLINQMYTISGVSQANATGQKPPEVKSGTAIEMVSDIAAGRFELQGQQLERAIVQAAKLFIDIGREIYKRNPKLAVKTMLKGNKYLTEIPFSEVADITDEEFLIKCFPVSMLSSNPAGKMDQLMQMVQAGWIQKEDAMNEMQLIDLDNYTNLQTAPLNLIRKILSKMVNDGIYTAPVPFMNLQLALSESTLELMRAQLDGVEEENCQLVRDFINDVNDLLNAAQPPPPPQQTAPQAGAGSQGTPIPPGEGNPPPAGSAPVNQAPATVSPPGTQGPQTSR